MKGEGGSKYVVEGGETHLTLYRKMDPPTFLKKLMRPRSIRISRWEERRVRHKDHARMAQRGCIGFRSRENEPGAFITL